MEAESGGPALVSLLWHDVWQLEASWNPYLFTSDMVVYSILKGCTEDNNLGISWTQAKLLINYFIKIIHLGFYCRSHLKSWFHCVSRISMFVFSICNIMLFLHLSDLASGSRVSFFSAWWIPLPVKIEVHQAKLSWLAPRASPEFKSCPQIITFPFHLELNISYRRRNAIPVSLSSPQGKPSFSSF